MRVAVRVEEYIRPDGSSPYRDWFDDLDPQAAAKVATALLRLAAGNTSRVRWFGGIGEYVIHWGAGYRVYLARDGEEVVILFGGGTKRRQPVDVARAKLLHAEYKARKRALASARRVRGPRRG